MRLLKILLATALFLDAAMMLTGKVEAATAPDQSVGYTVDNTSLAVAAR